MAKFGRMVLGVDGPAEAFRGPLASDTAQLRAALEQACESVHVVTFSRLVTDPSRTSRLLARWLRPHIGGAPDWRSMASRVRSRDPGCLPDMELERSLLDESLAGDVDA